MDNNLFLRRFRYAFNFSDFKMIKIFELAGIKLTKDEVRAYLSNSEEENFKKLKNKDLLDFLDAFIIYKRGKKDDEKKENANLNEKFENKNNINNVVLRKLKIALSLQSEDMIEIFKLGGHEISKSELSAIFRSEEHKNYREAGDKYLRVFVKGLITKYREEN